MTAATQRLIFWTGRWGWTEHPITSEVVQNICLSTAESSPAEPMNVGKLFYLLNGCEI